MLMNAQSAGRGCERMHLNHGGAGEEGGMGVMAHSLPLLLLTVMCSFMTGNICHFVKKRRSRPEPRPPVEASAVQPGPAAPTSV